MVMREGRETETDDEQAGREGKSGMRTYIFAEALTTTEDERTRNNTNMNGTAMSVVTSTWRCRWRWGDDHLQTAQAVVRYGVHHIAI